MPPRSPDPGLACAGHFGRNEWTLSSETAGHLQPLRVVTFAEIHSRKKQLPTYIGKCVKKSRYLSDTDGGSTVESSITAQSPTF